MTQAESDIAPEPAIAADGPEIAVEDPSVFPTTVALARETHIVSSGKGSLVPGTIGTPEEMSEYGSLRGAAPDTFQFYSLANAWGGCCAREIMQAPGTASGDELKPLGISLGVIVTTLRDAAQRPEDHDWDKVEALQRDLIRVLRERPQSSPSMLNGLDMIEVTLTERNADRAQ
jgi:hypothetical protein